MSRVERRGVGWAMIADPSLQGMSSARSRAWRSLGWAGALVAVACAAEEGASSAGSSGGGPNAGDALGAGAGTSSAGGSLCPAPTPAANTGTEPSAVWSRSPEDGACCRYESALAAPTSWAYFPTLSECQSSCRCAALEGFMAGSGGFDRYETERSSLECRCSAETCPSSVAEAAQMMCGGSSSGSVVRREGCGRVMLSGLAGDTWIFERASQSADAGGAGERLVGAVRLSDVPLAPCQTYEWIAGSRFDCDDVTTCQLCGSEAASTLPPCQ